MLSRIPKVAANVLYLSFGLGIKIRGALAVEVKRKKVPRGPGKQKIDIGRIFYGRKKRRRNKIF